MADSKLSTFLTTNKLNPKRLLAVSHKLETLTRDDRTIKLDKVRAKKGAADGGDAGEKKELGKPRSGAYKKTLPTEAISNRQLYHRRPSSTENQERPLVF